MVQNQYGGCSCSFLVVLHYTILFMPPKPENILLHKRQDFQRVVRQEYLHYQVNAINYIIKLHR